MAMDDPVTIPSSLGSGSLEDFEMDLEDLLQESQQQHRSRAAAAATLERERELNIIHFGGFNLTDGYDPRNMLSEEKIRSYPSYLGYYQSNEASHQRLHLPALSKEDWLIARRFQAGASTFGGTANGSDGLLFSPQSGLPPRGVGGEQSKMRQGLRRSFYRQPPSEWGELGNNDLIGPAAIGVNARKNFADALQKEHDRNSSAAVRHLSFTGRGAFDNVVDQGVSDPQLLQLQSGLETVDRLKMRTNSPGLVRAQSFSSSISNSFTGVIGPSVNRSITPDPQVFGNSSNLSLPIFGRRGEISSNGISTSIADHHDIAAALSGLNLSNNRLENEGKRGQSYEEYADNGNYLFNMSNDYNNYLQHQNMKKSEVDSLSIPGHMLPAKHGAVDNTLSKMTSNGQINLQNGIASTNAYEQLLAGSGFSNGSGSSVNVDFPMNHVGSFAGDSFLSNLFHLIFSNLLKYSGSVPQSPLMDPLLVQYLLGNDSVPNAAIRLSDSSLGQSTIGSSQIDSSAYNKKASLETSLAQHKLQYGIPSIGKTGGLNDGYHGASFDLGMQYPPDPTSGSILSSLGNVSPLRQGERFSRFPATMRRSPVGPVGSWNSESGSTREGFASSLLEEFKSNKTRSFELSEIADHVVEFSADQHGSRFIQQKLEVASDEEKNKIFSEILPHARALMTDVFGNYVIQKFFEHGTERQRKQLAGQLIGHVLQLSLQMYGCRVIQKALEVVDVDQQAQMVSELDGSVMKCVRDQNGNHVIQKCIECVPQDSIQFIISAFYGQVVPLSTHPYGCRVIQRVLEHCDDTRTQGIMMDEILQAVCTLTQDQYGNYVIQHVLQHGKPEERSAIIIKLSGQIVKMSQQKFASNVIEKCLTYGTADERQVLINEILGPNDENEPLQAMMKDQFGNYVVQKVLETCDDQNRELILSRIKAHVSSLKKYTYGKHIAARVEKVIAAGERRMLMSSNAS
ncbi:unnamed protein product [Spirodela intermedia]|uniref:PUM-HD domain-containing protein n=1 Tax=Spirodela intermedia TaxID=51605 RepID=A0A7I8JAT2_SPIIN|nr:unnamed protein product [Spirodela intermedia]CAA6666552.1 unnamed protein product [Spirodela intermedia]